MSRRRPGGTGPRPYARTARVNELLREIVADELARLDDDRLATVAVTGVEADPELRTAVVWVDSLAGPDGDEEVLATLARHRVRLQAAIAAQARTRRTPTLRFVVDETERTAERIERILRSQQPAPGATGDAGGDGPAGTGTGPDTAG